MCVCCVVLGWCFGGPALAWDAGAGVGFEAAVNKINYLGTFEINTLVSRSPGTSTSLSGSWSTMAGGPVVEGGGGFEGEKEGAGKKYQPGKIPFTLRFFRVSLSDT